MACLVRSCTSPKMDNWMMSGYLWAYHHFSFWDNFWVSIRVGMDWLTPPKSNIDTKNNALENVSKRLQVTWRLFILGIYVSFDRGVLQSWKGFTWCLWKALLRPANTISNAPTLWHHLGERHQTGWWKRWMSRIQLLDKQWKYSNNGSHLRNERT